MTKNILDSLITALQKASEGLLYMSESDYPYKVIRWEGSPETSLTEEFIRQKAEVSDDTPVEIVEFSDFYDPGAPDPDWYGETEKAEATKFRNLMKLLMDNLAHLKIFRVGEIEIDIYIVGQVDGGEIVGLATKAIET